jgi:hypothetical protein
VNYYGFSKPHLFCKAAEGWAKWTTACQNLYHNLSSTHISPYSGYG